MKIAAAYIRVSTDDQVEYSPDSQKKAIIDYAKRNGLYVPDDLIFADEGISGRSTKRPAFQRMIGLAKTKPKPFDVILVWKFSRFARNREDSIVYKSMLRKQCGIDVVSISEQLGEDKTSILIEALLEAMDEYYSINLAEEVVRGMSEKARRGGTMGSLPFGYRSENGRPVPDETNAPIVRRIFRDFTDGTPHRTIAMRLTDEGIMTSKGRPWTNRTIEYVLRNIFYIGCTHWTPEKVKGAKHYESISEKTIITENTHEPIIDKETFDKAQKILDDLKQKHPYKAHPTHGRMFMLKGVVRCSNCGGTLTTAVADKSLQCHHYARGECKVSHNISIAKLNDLVLSQIKSDIETGRIGIGFQRRRKPPIAIDSKDVEADIERLKTRLQRASQAYQAGIDTLEEYAENKKLLQSQIDLAEAKLKCMTESASEPTPEEIKKFRDAMETGIKILESDAPAELKNDIIKTIAASIVFHRDTTSVEVIYNI